MRSGHAVSVVVPHYGPPELTLGLVHQLRTQTHEQLEVIVADDCSPQPFPEVEGVRLVRRQHNGGFGSAVNSGAAIAHGELLLILNSDLTITPTFVADLVAAAAPWQPAVTGPLIYWVEQGRDELTGRHFPTATSSALEWLTVLARHRHRRALTEGIGNDTACVPGAVVPVDWLVGAALLLPRDCFEAVGGFDESYFMNGEEVDLQRRLRDHGIPSVFLGTVRVEHVGGASSDPQRRQAWAIAARHRYARRWGFGRRLKVALGAATMVNAVTNGVRQLAGREVDAATVARREWRLAMDQVSEQ
ncbi:MAG: glycosyltransferase family 2 protein [Tetrasphaera sp.]|nr:glycosyltransferase family 2 protein [Tetrasphaera sp.]